MVNKSKIKGTTWESAIVAALVAAGYVHAERRALQGALDKGDIAGIPGVMIEAKNLANLTLAQLLREVEAEKANAKADIGVGWAKLRGKANPLDCAVIMTGREFIDILDRLGYKPQPTKTQPLLPGEVMLPITLDGETA